MRFSSDLLNRVEAALPPAQDAAIAVREVHDRVGAWNRTTVRHALCALVQSGRASFIGKDRHRKYRCAGAGAPMPAPAEEIPPEPPGLAEERESWRDYALRGDGSVRLPDEEALAAAMARLGLCYRDVDATTLAIEECLPGWSPRPRSNAALTRAVFGDPEPGRRRPS